MASNRLLLNFDLGETADAMRETVHAFSPNEIAPRAAEIDRSKQFPIDLWPEMGELGLHGITVEEEYGGADMGYLAHCVAMEEISRAPRPRSACPTARTPTSASTRSTAGAREEQKRKLPAEADLRRACRRAGDVRARRRLRRGLDALRADRKGDRYVLNGSKMWITNGHYAETLVVYAKTDPDAGPRGITAFLIEKGFKGFRPAQKLDKLGMRGSPTPASWCSRTARCRKRTCWARSARASTC